MKALICRICMSKFQDHYRGSDTISDNRICLSLPMQVAGVIENNTEGEIQAGPASYRRGSASTTLIRMGEATALPLVLCGLLQHEFGSPFSPMPSRRSSQIPQPGGPRASSPLLLEQSMKIYITTVFSTFHHRLKLEMSLLS